MIRDYLFAFDESDVFWATTDLDRINGHALTVYGTLLNGGTAVIFEGGPNYPDPARYWETIAKYGVNKFCANSALIRACAAAGMNPAAQFDLSSLEIIGTAGEPLYPPEWEWFSENVGAARRPIIATWGQAETGGPLLSPIPGMVAGRPGSVSVPFFGVDPVILDLDTGEEAKFPNQEGALFLRRPWPGMAVTIQGDHEGYREAYFAPFAPGWFLTGEGALKDEDGFYRITGRMDDIINCAGFRMGAWELETALGDDDDVAEAGVVGFPHSIKGQGLYAFVKLESGVDKAPDLVDRLRESMADRFGKPAVPDVIQWVDALPKTRSGKILRRLLQKIAAGSINMGDLSTVADKKVVEKLIAERPTDIE
jgi:acetyl-CoA synthetase